jgi:chromosome segregation ATPase
VKSLENAYNLQIEDLERIVSSQREEIADLEKKFSEGDATSSGLVEELNKERVTKEAINKQLDTMSEEAWSAKSAKDSMSKELDALSQNLAAVKISNEKEIAEVIAVKESLQKQIEALSEEIVAIKSERDNATEAAKEAAAKEVEVLSGEIAALKESKEATTNKLIVLSEELATAKADKEAALETAKTELKAALEAHSSSAEASLKDSEAKLEDASKEKEATISAALAKAEVETSEIEKARQGLQKKLNEKDVIIEKFTKEHKEYESEIPSLKEKLALAEALVREKEAAVKNLKKEQEAGLNVLRAELAEARLGKGAETGNAEVSTSTGDAGAHCYPSGYDAEDKGVVAIVRHPIFWTWMFYFPCSLIYFGCCLEPGTKFCFTADV